MPGRPPKPTALKLLQGNPGKRPLNDREPKPAVGCEMPEFVKGDPLYVAEWNREAPRLIRLGILTEIDGDILGRVCVLRVKFRDQMAEGASASALAGTSKELRSLEAQLAIGAANRTRVKVEQPKPASKLGRFVGGA
jgi:hypothetical protein